MQQQWRLDRGGDQHRTALLRLAVQSKQALLPGQIAGDLPELIEREHPHAVPALQSLGSVWEQLRQWQIGGRDACALRKRAHRLQQMALADPGRSAQPAHPGAVALCDRPQVFDCLHIEAGHETFEHRALAQPNGQRQLLHAHARATWSARSVNSRAYRKPLSSNVAQVSHPRKTTTPRAGSPKPACATTASTYSSCSRVLILLLINGRPCNGPQPTR